MLCTGYYNSSHQYIKEWIFTYLNSCKENQLAHEYFSVLHILQVGQQILLCKERGIEEAVQTLTHHRQPLTLWKDASRLLLDLDKRLEIDMDK